MRAIFENAKKLANALAFVTGVIPKRTPMPILAHVWVEVRDGTLMARATDLDGMRSASVQVADSEPGVAVVPAVRLAKLVTELPNGSAVTFKLGNDRVLINCDRGRWWLPTLSSENFPSLFALNVAAAQFTLPARIAQLSVERTLYAASTEEIRYYLNGVNLQRRDEKLVCAATNGRVLSEVEFDIDPGRDLNAIVPLRMVETLKTIAGFGDVNIAVDNEKISFTCGSWQAVSKLIDGTFPEYTRIIPPASDNCIEVKSADLLGAIARAESVAEMDTAIGLVWNAEEPLIQICLARSEDNVEELDAVVSGAARVAASASYLTQTVEALDSEMVRLDCSSSHDPIRITAVDHDADTGSVALVMPMVWITHHKKEDEAA